MVESPPQHRALASNPNKSNVLSPYFGYSFRQPGFDLSPCMTDISSSFQSFSFNDENTPPPSCSPDGAKTIGSSAEQMSEQTELALVKAELEVTRRKLAEYEGRKADVPHTSPQIVKFNPTSRNLFAGKPSNTIHPRDVFDYPDPSFAQVPPPPYPLPVDASTPLSPLHLPSSLSGAFPPKDGVFSGLVLDYFSLKVAPVPPRESFRSVSATLPPIGDHLRTVPMQRTFALDIKNPPAHAPGNTDSELSSPWHSSNRTEARQQPILGPGLLEPWHDVSACSCHC